MAGIADLLGSIFSDPAVRQQAIGELQRSGQDVPPELMPQRGIEQQMAAPQEAPLMGDFEMDPRVQTGMDEPTAPTGMFGVKGTARDILGTLGDTLLMAYRGAEPTYGPQKKQEEQGAILRDFQKDPEGAIRKMASTGNTQAANKMYEMYVKKQQDDAEAQQKLAKERLEAIPEERKLAASFIPRMTEAAYGSQKQAFDEFFADNPGVKKPFELPTVYNAEELKRLQAFALTPDEYLDNKRADQTQQDTRDYRDALTADKSINTLIRAGLAQNTIYNTEVDNTNAARNTDIKDATENRRATEAKKGGGRKTKPGGGAAYKDGATKQYTKDKPFTLSNGKVVKKGDFIVMRGGKWDTM